MKKLKIGLCGYGGLGRMHAANLAAMDNAEIVAVCDNNPKKLEAKEISINIQQDGPVFDIRECRIYTDLKTMLKKEKLDAVVTALPTNLHAKYAIMSMDAGCHVFSEKPMALTVEECDKMIKARDRNKRQLMIGQCIRFWPAYEKLKETIADESYGKLRSFMMTRIGAYCNWADPNWFNDGKCSGGAILDLHLHDVDWVYYALGKPESLCAAGSIGRTGAIDDVTAIWEYNNFIVTMRGSWMYQGFHMSFQAFFENGVMEYGIHPEPELKVRLKGQENSEKITVSSESGYPIELRYFLDCIQGKTVNTVCTAESTKESVGLVMLENKSIEKKKWIKLKNKKGIKIK